MSTGSCSSSSSSTEEVRDSSSLPPLDGVDNNFSLKLYDTSKSFFKRLSQDDDDRIETSRKLSLFLECVLGHTEEERRMRGLAKFFGLLPPFIDQVHTIRQMERMSTLQKQRSIGSIEEPDHSSFAEFFEQRMDIIDDGNDNKDEEFSESNTLTEEDMVVVKESRDHNPR